MKKIMALLIGVLITATCLQVQAATLVTRFIATPTDTSTFKESVKGCSTTSVDIAKGENLNTVFNLYNDGSFELGYDSNLDGDLLDGFPTDVVILTGIWSNIDTDLTKFRFQPDGDLELGTFGWGKIYSWTVINGCYFDTANDYQYTYPSTFRILKSDMTINYSSLAGTLTFSLQGYGQTTQSLAIPPKLAPLMKFDMKATGFWYSPPAP